MFKQIVLTLLLVGNLMAAMDVNRASKEDFMSINGIGEKKAEAIIKYRKKHGKFKSVDDLKNVKGIGDSIVNNVKKGKKKSTKSTKAKQSTKKVDSKKKKTQKSSKKADKKKKTTSKQ